MEAQAEIKWADLPSPPGPIQLFTFLFFKLHKLSAKATGLSVLTSLGFGLAMIQVDEYLVAILCWFLGSLVFFAKAIHWNDSNGRLVVTAFGKLGYGSVAIVFFLLLYMWTEVKRGDRPLSILIFPKVDKLSVEKKLEGWLAKRKGWTAERLPDIPDLNFVYRVYNEHNEVVLISKKKDQSIIAIHTRFFSPPSVIRVIDSLSADQQFELSNELRKTMTDAHITHFAIEEQPFRVFVLAEDIDVGSVTEDKLIGKTMRGYKSLYLLLETMTVVVKRMTKDRSQP